MRRLVLAAALALAPGLARAQNLVANGSFEDGTFAGVTGRTTPVGWAYGAGSQVSGGQVVRASPLGAVAHTGAYLFAIDEGVGISGPLPWSLTQTLATTPGTAYQFSFWTYSPLRFAANASLTFGNVTLSATPLTIGSAYQQFTAVAIATGTTTTLALTGYNDPSYTFVDDVAVTATPEPSALALAAAGLAGAGLIARRRRA